MALLLAMILGAVPLRKADPSDLGRLNHGARAGSMLLTRGRRGLLAAQTAIATVLLAVAGLLLAVVLQLMATSPGFDAAHVTAMIVGRVHDLDAGGRARYYSSVLAAVAGLPGVTSAALNDYVPLTNEDDYEGLEIPGRPRDGSGQLPREEWRRVSAGYFQTMRIPLVRGRLFTAADDERAPSVVVINESLAGKYFAGGNPIGQRIRITSTPYGWSEIVGIVGDVREAGLDRAPKPMMFVPYHRDPRPVMGLFVARPTESETMTRAIADAVRSIDPGRPVFEARSMSGIVADSYAIQRSTLGMAAGLASLALLLMLGGTYAVVDLVAAARAREIALRVALGAGRADVLGAVLGQPCAAAIAGIAVGLALAWAAASALPSLVGGVRPLDAPLAAGVAFLVGLAVGAACLAPARRALRVDPAVALRGE
jgi:predicted permease